MPFSLKASHITTRTALLTLETPFSGSLIQMRNSMSIELSPKFFNWHTGLGKAEGIGVGCDIDKTVPDRRHPRYQKFGIEKFFHEFYISYDFTSVISTKNYIILMTLQFEPFGC